MVLIVGLGNPGAGYKKTNHNVGSDVLQGIFQVLKEQKSFIISKSYQDNLHNMKITHNNFQHNLLFYWCPDFMNISGRSVRQVAQKHYAKMIIILVDELDLPINTCKIHRGSGSNGHKGVKSIRENVGNLPIILIKIGIGRPNTTESVSDYVLRNNPNLRYDIITIQVLKQLLQIMI